MSEKRAFGSSLLKSFLVLAVPTVIEQLLTTILQYVDTAMVGHLGADATAAISLSSTYGWFFNSIISALGLGFLSYIARAIGEKNTYKIRHAAGMALGTALTIGIVLTVVTQAIAGNVPVWMGAEESIRAAGTLYFRLIHLPMIFRAFLLICASVLRSTGDSRTPMKINVFMNVMNMVLNGLFIYGFRLGVAGAGIATALSYAAGGILMFSAFAKNSLVSMEKQYRVVEKTILLDILRIAIPAMGTNIVSCLGYIVATSFVSSMSTTVFAAHSIAITAEQLFYIPGFGMQAATSTLVGNALGERNRKKEHAIMRIAVSIIVAIMIVSGAALFFGAEFMMRLFTPDEEVIGVGAELLRLVALTEPIYGAAIVLDGIFVGLGRTKIPLVIELIGRWGIRIFGSFLLITLAGGGILVFWRLMVADNIARGILLSVSLYFVLRAEKRADTAAVLK